MAVFECEVQRQDWIKIAAIPQTCGEAEKLNARFMNPPVLVTLVVTNFASWSKMDVQNGTIAMDEPKWLFAVCAIRRLLLISLVSAIPSPTSAASIQARLESETQVSPQSGTLRDLTDSLAKVHDLAIQIDPRIDPRAKVSAPAKPKPLIRLLDELAAHAGARACVVGETVLITPIGDADRIATLAALRESELLDRPKKLDTLTRLRPKTIAPDIQPVSPNELLEQINAAYRLIAPGESLEHDLWHFELNGVTASEALALVLVPMGRSFEWSADGYTILPLPDEILVDRVHRIPAGRNRDDVVVSLESIMGVGFQPDRLDDRVVSFSGTVFEHDRLDELLSPKARSSDRPQEKRYTLQVTDRPASAILQALESQGLSFEWDRGALMLAGVDLAQNVSIDVTTVTAGELLTQIAEQIGAKVTVEAGGLQLVPK